MNISNTPSQVLNRWEVAGVMIVGVGLTVGAVGLGQSPCSELGAPDLSWVGEMGVLNGSTSHVQVWNGGGGTAFSI